MLKHRAYFVTGTDTDCGKTFVTLKLMKHLQSEGKKVLGVKPIASGVEQTSQGTGNPDALMLQAASDFSPSYNVINPFCFDLHVSPHIAADKMGVHIQAEQVAQQCLSQAMDAYDHIFFEGAGGVYAPINQHETMMDVMRAFQLPVILVVGVKLGCLNHARLSYEALQSTGLEILWMANVLDHEMPCLAENLDSLSYIFQEARRIDG